MAFGFEENMTTNMGPPKTRILVLHGFYDTVKNHEYEMLSRIVFINSVLILW